MLAYKFKVVGNESHGEYVEERKVISRQYIRLLGVQGLLKFDLAAVEKKEEKSSFDTDSVEGTGLVFKAGYEDDRQEKGKQKDEYQAEDKDTVNRVKEDECTHTCL